MAITTPHNTNAYMDGCVMTLHNACTHPTGEKTPRYDPLGGRNGHHDPIVRNDPRYEAS